MTTSGDIIYGGVSGNPYRLAKGTDGQVLTLVSGLPAWSNASSGGMSNPMTTPGDIIYGGTSGSPYRLAKGSDGQVLTLTSGLPSWQAASGGLSSRADAVYTTASLAANATATFSLTIPKLCQMVKLATNYPAWVRVYGTSAARTADSSRLITEDYAQDTAIFVDASTASSLTLFGPRLRQFVNLDNTPADTAYVSLKNLDSTSRIITLTITNVRLEA
jgi:hypothetical protein